MVTVGDLEAAQGVIDGACGLYWTQALLILPSQQQTSHNR